MAKKSQIPNAQPPESHAKLKIKRPKNSAGGIEAVTNALRHVYGEVGVVQGTKIMLEVNQFKGFDCPGCAWPDPDNERAAAEFCENGAKAIAEEATTDKVDKEFFKKYPVEEISSWSDYSIGKSGRITDPFVLREGKHNYEPVSWEEAFNLIGDNLKRLSSPDEAVFYTSGRTSNEAAFLYQLFVRQFGTNNLPDCSNMCHESSGTALTETVGIGKGSVKLEDFYEAEVIFIIGQNPGTNHPRMLTALQKAKKNGAVIISANPLHEAGLMNFKHPQKPADLIGKGTNLTDLYLQVRVNGDVPMLMAINKLLLKKEADTGGILDRGFISSKTAGFGEYEKYLEEFDLDELIRMCGIPAEEIHKAADILASKSKIIICWAMGLTQHKNAVDNIREIVNMLLLKGSIGKPGAGTCPVRGHSNVQGDRTMGIWEKANPPFIKKLEEVFNFTAPKKDGYDTVHAIKAMAEGKAKVFIGLGGNFLSATPDTEYTAEALRQCDLTVHISTKLNRSHLIHGKNALILPCLGRTEKDVQADGEQFVSVENSTGVVHSSSGHKAPVSDNILSEIRIIAGMAMAALGVKNTVDWQGLFHNYDRIRDLIEKVIPGFDDYNLRVRKPAGFYLPNGARINKFNTLTGKANFSLNKLPDHQLHDDEYLMMTIRSHDQFNTTIYGLHDRYRGIYNERRVVLMNEGDMIKAGLKANDAVDIKSFYETERIAKSFLVIPYNIPSGCVATYFPEANVLVPFNQYAEKSRTPISKSVKVKIFGPM